MQTALLQVAEATQAASKAAQAAAQSAAQAASSPSASAGQPKAAIDWSKLVNKPPVFGEMLQQMRTSDCFETGFGS